MTCRGRLRRRRRRAATVAEACAWLTVGIMGALLLSAVLLDLAGLV